MDPFAVGMHGANKARIRAGDVAVVIGAGPIGMVTTALGQHRATLERHQDGWVLRYPIRGPSIYGERSFNHPIESTLPLVGETREDALQIAELFLRDHKPPTIPTEFATQEPTPPLKFAMRRNIELKEPSGRL